VDVSESTRFGAPRPGPTLDELLAQLKRRLTSVATDRDRLRSLLDAVLAVGDDLDLQAVLHRITEVAVTLADATYGALGILTPDGAGLAQFLTVGISADDAAQIGPTPQGHGVLGKLIVDPKALRLNDLRVHPDSFGFPPGHPLMRTFLGVPVRVRGAVFGNLYLAEKAGGGSFTDDDEQVVTALAGAAGVAIWNARLYGESVERERWLTADADVATALLSGAEPEEVLSLVATSALETLRGEVAFIALPVDEENLLVEVAAGPTADTVRGRLLPTAGCLGQVLAAGRAVVLEPGVLPVPMNGPVLVVPLAAPPLGQGLLVVAGLAPEDLAGAVRVLGGFAAQAGVALELSAHRSEVQRYAVFEDRDRIARDLHDLVIQRLFATGMQLEGASRLITEHPREAARRVRAAVDDLDGTIRELRSTIYGLQAPSQAMPSLRSRLLEAVDAGAELLSFAPSVQLEGLIDTLVPLNVGDHLLAVVREALSNVARHAHASCVEVHLVVRPDGLSVQVTDNGVGLGAAGRRSGLANLQARARELGGTLVMEPGPAAGLVLTWSVPFGCAAAPTA